MALRKGMEVKWGGSHLPMGDSLFGKQNLKKIIKSSKTG